MSKQHKSPCSDCPWRRKSSPGWVGGETPKEWVRHAHNETVVDCHLHPGKQCAGMAVFRANICKSVRDPKALDLPPDKENVFSNGCEFRGHHEQLGHTSADGSTPDFRYACVLCGDEFDPEDPGINVCQKCLTNVQAERV